MSNVASDKPAAALAAVGYARLRDSAEFKRAPLYFDAVRAWYDGLTEDQRETGGRIRCHVSALV